MRINDLFQKKEGIFNDDNNLYYFSEIKKQEIIKFIDNAKLDDFLYVADLSDTTIIPTWYYLLNDYDVASSFINRKDFILITEQKKDNYSFENRLQNYNNSNEKIFFNKLDSQIMFINDYRVMKMIVNKGFKFKDVILDISINNLSKTLDLLENKVFEFDENLLIKSGYSSIQYVSIIEKLLNDYQSKKDSQNELLLMAKGIKRLIDLGANENTCYTRLVTSVIYDRSEFDNYKNIIKKYCPELHIFLERLEIEEKFILNAEEKKKIINNNNKKKI